MLGISAAGAAKTIGAGLVLGGAAGAFARYSPVEGQWQNGVPKGGPITRHDWSGVAVATALGALAGVWGSLAGAHAVNTPAPPSARMMIAGATVFAMAGAGLALGAAARD